MYDTFESKQERLDFLRNRNNWSSTAPKAAGVCNDDPSVDPDPDGDAPLKQLLDPLYESLYDFRTDEKNLSDLVGDVDVSWLAGRSAMTKRRRWNIYMPDDGTKFRDCLEAAITGSEPGRRVFDWLDKERESTKDGTVERSRVDHAYSHTLAFAVHNIPPGLNDEAISSVLARAFLTVKSQAIDPHHIEIASRAFIDLYGSGWSSLLLGEAPQWHNRYPTSIGTT